MESFLTSVSRIKLRKSGLFFCPIVLTLGENRMCTAFAALKATPCRQKFAREELFLHAQVVAHKLRIMKVVTKKQFYQ